ncbi:MAG: hypothetical protein RI885_1172 [Actinomycetota bacterium]
MTLTLRVIVDDVVAPSVGGIGRYAEELTRELIATAPPGCEVAGVVSSSPPADYDELHTLLPGMADLFKSALARRELQLAWQHGITRLPGSGMVHAPSLLAPLSKHDRVNNVGDQTVVTIHDALPWTHPETLPGRQAAWARGMAKRAQKYADAVIVPTHTVAQQLGEVLELGERVRVIGGAPSSRLRLPPDADARATALALPERYVLTLGSLAPHKGLEPLIRSLASVSDAGLPLVIAGPAAEHPDAVSALAEAAGVDLSRVICLGRIGDADLATAIDRATVFAFPSVAEGFGLPVIEAFSLGTPVVHSDAAALVEVSAGAGLSVASAVADEYPDRLAATITRVVEDEGLARRLGFSGLDRAAAFSWTDAARQVWQLHADL